MSLIEILFPNGFAEYDTQDLIELSNSLDSDLKARFEEEQDEDTHNCAVEWSEDCEQCVHDREIISNE